jgi:Ca2+-binding RTX toxin-like protein
MPENISDREQAAIVIRDLSSGLYTADEALDIVENVLTVLSFKFESLETLQKNIDSLEEWNYSIGKMADSLSKSGVTGFIAKVLYRISNKIESTLEKADAALEKVTDQSKKIGEVIEQLQKSIEGVGIVVQESAAFTNFLSQRIATADQNLAKAESLIPLPDEVTNIIAVSNPGLIDGIMDVIAIGQSGNGANSGFRAASQPASALVAQPASALVATAFSLDELPVSIDAALFAQRLKIMEIQSTAQLDYVGDIVTDINETVSAATGVLGSIEGAFLNNPIFDVFKAFDDAISSVTNALAPVFRPLQKIYDALSPVVDALGSIFGWILAPLEWALEAVIKATGIGSLLDSLADQVTSFLPDLDFFDGILEQLTDIYLVNLPKELLDNVTEPLDDLLDTINDVTFPDFGVTGTQYNDFLTGSMTSTGPLTIEGLGGDDNLFGGVNNDTLLGGSGSDFLVGGAGDDYLDGGDNPNVTVMLPSRLNPNVLEEQVVHEPDYVIYEGSRDDYAIVSEIGDDGAPTGRWIISDNRSDAQIAASATGVRNGTDQLFNIEIVFWDDKYLDLTAFDTFIETKSLDGQLIQVTPDYSDIPNVPDPADPNGPGIEVKTGDLANDLVIGDIGIDFIMTGGGNDQLNSNTNGPLSRQYAFGDLLYGGDDNDVYVAGVDSARYDFIEDSGGLDTLDLAAHRGALLEVGPYGERIYEDTPLTVFLGVTEREEFYRPISVPVDIDFIGEEFNPNIGFFGFSVFNGGVARGIENVIGTRFGDIIIGNDGVNILNGGAGSDQMRGLDGDDVLLGGDGSDTLIGDGGDDYLDGGAGYNTYIGGLGNDEIVDNSGIYSTVHYSARGNSPGFDQYVEFIDFFDTGFGIDDMPAAVYILATEKGDDQMVFKYSGEISGENLIGADTLKGIESIIASVGDDIIFTAREISQTIFANDGNDIITTAGGGQLNKIYGEAGDDAFIGDSLSKDRFYGGVGSDTVFVVGDDRVQGDMYYGDYGSVESFEGIDVLDLSDSEFSWHIWIWAANSRGTMVGMDPLSAFDVDDPLYIQPTLGVFNEVYPDVPSELRVADSNTAASGGRAERIGEFEHIFGSEQRDFISGGNDDKAIGFWGNGGDDVLYAAQRYGAQLYGGEGNDVLGTFNDTFGNERPINWFDEEKLTVMFGEAGNDTFVAGDFREQFDGGSGIDNLTYEVSTAGVRVNLTALTLGGGYATGDILLGGIENVTGSQFDDILLGDDMINELVGWDGNDVIRGFDGADVLFGNDGDDLLYGGAGTDVLHGGNGGDLLHGGEGIDTASFNLYQVHPKGGVYRLTGDTIGITVDLQSADAAGEILAGGDILVSIENIQGSVGDDHFSGDAGPNMLAGNLGHDFLDGRGGDDLLIGGEGDDTLIGGAGNDFLVGGAGTNMLDGGDDLDTVDYGVLERGVEITMAGVGSRVGLDTGEVHYFTAVDLYVWADSIPKAFDENTPWNEILAIATFEDRYTYQVSSFGTDDLVSIEATVTPERLWFLNPAFARNATDLEGVRFLFQPGLLADPNTSVILPEILLSKAVAVIDDFVAATDLIKNIERIVGSRGDDRILGNAEDTFFYGASGADTIDGGDGIDTASYERAGILADEGDTNYGVTVDLENQIFTGGEAEGDVLTNIENIIGSNFDDILGGDAADNRLTIGLGNNQATGGAGTDTVVFSYASTDLIVQEISGMLRIERAEGENILGEDRIGTDVEFFEFTDRTLTLSEMRDQVGDGTEEDDLLIGSPIDDYLFGKGGNDVIEGRASDDVLDGGPDNDLLKGEAGNDRLIGGTGKDRFIGGLGDDTFVVDRTDEIVTEALDEGIDTVETSVDFTLPDHVENLVLMGSGPTTGTGNALGNVITGSDQNEVLLGRDGNDTLDGGLGIDTLIGGEGNDRYLINDTFDVVDGETIDGGFDIIVTTVDYTLPTNVELIAVKGFGNVRITGNAQDNQFHDGTGPLFGTVDLFDGIGDSTFDGGAGNDTLILSYDFANSTFSFDAEGFLVIRNGLETDRARDIERFDFADEFRTLEQLLLEAFPPQNVTVFAGNYYVGATAIDMSPEGGGTQFIFAGDLDSGNNDSNEYNYNISFGGGGKAEFTGTQLNAQNEADGRVNSISVDFTGGNTTRMSVFSFEKTLAEMKAGDWSFWQSAIFGGDDRITGSYLNDKLVGYEGNDTIFGGLGDKLQYNVATEDPSPKPSAIRTPGQVATNPDDFVADGNDFIDGRGGNDILDGGTGSDILLGGAGNDTLYGGGGDFADRLFGGAGSDDLYGGAGSDTFVLALGMDYERVWDFDIGIDNIDFSSLSGAEFDAIEITIDPVLMGGSTLITLSDGSEMALFGVTLTELPIPILTADNLNGLNGSRIDLGVRNEMIALSDVGDVNNDGIDDFAIGWAQAGFSSVLTPITYIVYGREGGFDPLIEPYLLGLDQDTSFESAPGTDALAISAAGDFNGDGIDDILIANRTESHVIFGKDGNFPDFVSLDSLAPGDGIKLDFGFGYNSYPQSITGGLNLNNDAFDDVVISDSSGFGTIRVVFGTGDETITTISELDLDGTDGVIMTSSDHDFSYAGISQAPAGDINGDGIDDLIIGSEFKQVINQLDPAFYEWTGGAYVVFGAEDGFASLIDPITMRVDLGALTADQGVEVFGDFATGQSRTGRSVEGGGDVNGDGFDDVGVGRSGLFFDEDNDTYQYAAYVLYGAPGELGAEAQLADLNDTDPLNLPDGSQGTIFKLNTPESYGIPYTGGPMGGTLPGNNGFVLYSTLSQLAIVEDLNNDRIDDIVISAVLYEKTVTPRFDPEAGGSGRWTSDEVRVYTGSTYVVYGKEGGLGPSVDLDALSAGEGFRIDGGDNEFFGLPISSAGDINGDGGNDLLIGATNAPSMLIYGTPFSNLPVTGAVLILGLAAEDETLSANVSTIADRDGIANGFDYQWLRDGAPITQNGNGETYTLGDADVGTAISLRISFTDGEGKLETVTSAATMLVSNTDDVPVAVDDSTTGNEDTVLKINVLGNDNDDDGDLLTITAVTQGDHGAVGINDDGTVSYTPDVEFSGTDAFSYTISDGNGGIDQATVSITINNVNDAPITTPDDVTLDEETTATVEVLRNDTDVDSTTFTVIDAVGVTQTSTGGKATVIHLGNGVFEVTGVENAHGTDSFTYTVEDEGGATATGTINITLNPTPDAPTPQDDQYFEPEDDVQTFNVLINDTDPDGEALSVVAVTNGTFTQAEITQDGLIRVTPEVNATGLQTLTYTVRDASGLEATAELLIRYLPLNDAPVAVDDVFTFDEDVVSDFEVLLNDTDPDGDTLMLVSFPTSTRRGDIEDLGDGVLRYTPDPNFHGTETFSYTVEDPDGLTSTATATIIVNAVNDAPDAREDTSSGLEDITQTVDVLTNDRDIDSEGFSLVGVAGGLFTTAVINLDNTITITPTADFEGEDTVFYTIEDTEGLQSVGEINVTFTPVNDAPRPANDDLIGLEGTRYRINVLDDDIDVDLTTGDFSLLSYTDQTFGAVTLFGDGLEYTPFNNNVDFFGTDSFTYTVIDSEGFFTDALDPTDGEFLMPLVGVLEDPFAIA